MSTKDRAHLGRCIGGVLSVATAIAVVGGVVEITAAPPSSKVQMCHVTGNGGAHMISISGEAESAHRAHGDARPGEAVPDDTSVQFDDECKQVQRRPPESPLACPCWNTYTNTLLLQKLNASPASNSWCLANSSAVSLSSDPAANALVYADLRVCLLRLDGQYVAYNFSLAAAQATQCRAEAAALIPNLTWCPQ